MKVFHGGDQRESIVEEIKSINIPELKKMTDILFEIAHKVNVLYLSLPINKME